MGAPLLGTDTTSGAPDGGRRDNRQDTQGPPRPFQGKGDREAREARRRPRRRDMPPLFPGDDGHGDKRFPFLRAGGGGVREARFDHSEGDLRGDREVQLEARPGVPHSLPRRHLAPHKEAPLGRPGQAREGMRDGRPWDHQAGKEGGIGLLDIGQRVLLGLGGMP